MSAFTKGSEPFEVGGTTEDAARLVEQERTRQEIERWRKGAALVLQLVDESPEARAMLDPNDTSCLIELVRRQTSEDQWVLHEAVDFLDRNRVTYPDIDWEPSGGLTYGELRAFATGAK